MSAPVHRSGYAALVGRPNVGKSTLLNHLLGEKISIVSRRPQTTRNRVLGIYSRDDLQVVLLDTPGLHDSDKLLNRRMVRDATDALGDVDVALLLVDASFRPDPAAHAQVLAALRDLPTILVLNKVDLIQKERLLPLIASWQGVRAFQAVVPVSALNGDGLGALIGELARAMPEGPAWFPKDMLTDAPERFVVAELIREEVFACLDQELPYAAAVEIEEFDETDRPKRVRIMARIHVERESQKGIVIGKGGQMIARIGTRARAQIERLLDCKVRLDLTVGVDPEWTRRKASVEALGWFGRSGGGA